MLSATTANMDVVVHLMGCKWTQREEKRQIYPFRPGFDKSHIMQEILDQGFNS
jgi:hypothetical protein